MMNELVTTCGKALYRKKDFKMMKRIGITKIGFYLFLILILTGNGGLNFMANAETANQVLVVTDPGYSGFSLKIAQNITEQLIRKNLSVKLVKVNQFRVQDLARVQLIVIGGPTYMAQPSGGLKKFVSKLKSGSGLKALVFQTGGTDCAGLAPLVKLVQEKGLLVIGSCGILQTPNEATENDNKIKKLLENI